MVGKKDNTYYAGVVMLSSVVSDEPERSRVVLSAYVAICLCVSVRAPTTALRDDALEDLFVSCACIHCIFIVCFPSTTVLYFF